MTGAVMSSNRVEFDFPLEKVEGEFSTSSIFNWIALNKDLAFGYMPDNSRIDFSDHTTLKFIAGDNKILCEINNFKENGRGGHINFLDRGELGARLHRMLEESLEAMEDADNCPILAVNEGEDDEDVSDEDDDYSEEDYDEDDE
jgi:hypothetical protein